MMQQDRPASTTFPISPVESQLAESGISTIDAAGEMQLYTSISNAEVIVDPLEALQRQLVLGVSYWPTADVSGLDAMDWVWFNAGLLLGAAVTLATSSFAAFFDPCLVQWAMVIATSFFFYLYMGVYMDSDFTEMDALIQMILSFVQFGQAVNLGQCSDENHGFKSSSGFHTMMGYFTLDVDQMEVQTLSTILDQVSKLFGSYGQDD